jgi:hypothetical protein
MVKTKHIERSATIKVEIKSLTWLDETDLAETDLTKEATH